MSQENLYRLKKNNHAIAIVFLEEQKKLILTGNVIYNNRNRRISYIAWNETSKSFLPCSIPVELK